MRIHRIEIERFRGIEKLDWALQGDFVCLVGPGDSRKSTILDAVDFALSPRWNIPFDDADFFAGSVDAPIEIRITVGDVPAAFKSDERFGLLARGRTTSGEFATSPKRKTTPSSRSAFE